MLEESYTIKVKDIMTPGWHIPFLEENAGWKEFLTVLSFSTHAWVVNNTKDMKIVGVITEHDMLSCIISSPNREKKNLGAIIITLMATTTVLFIYSPRSAFNTPLRAQVKRLHN